jgi:hypothetical protein
MEPARVLANELLRPNEQVLSAFSPDGQWDLQAHSRIQRLLTQHLQRMAASEDGWSVLYFDPQDGRYWELTFPHSAMHGGGPARLDVISATLVPEKYGLSLGG